MGSLDSRRIAATTSGPNVMLGTKWPSMTSRCRRPTPALSSVRTTRYKLPKSAVLMLAATPTIDMRSPSALEAVRGGERARALEDEQLAPALDGRGCGRARPISRQLTAGGTDVDAPVAPD